MVQAQHRNGPLGGLEWKVQKEIHAYIGTWNMRVEDSNSMGENGGRQLDFFKKQKQK